MFCVVVRAPGSERDLGMAHVRERGHVQQFVPQATVEVFDEGVLGAM